MYFNILNVIEEYILNNYKCEKIGDIKDTADTRIIYKIDYKGKKIGFFKIMVYGGIVFCAKIFLKNMKIQMTSKNQ